jgi:DNA-binding NtrC family response regulator
MLPAMSLPQSPPNAAKSRFARILVAEDDPSVARLLRYRLERDGYAVSLVSDGLTAWSTLQRAPFDLLITDVRMPGMNGIELLGKLRENDDDLPVLVLSAFSSVGSAVEAIKLGAYDYLQKPIENQRLTSVVRHCLDHAQLRKQAAVAATPNDADQYHGMVGRSRSMRFLFDTIEKIARFDTPVLIVGESGTGKELVAQAIHEASARSAGPFLAFNSAGLGDTMAESLLFGHRKGAFTGATSNHDGLMVAASGGTLFMDELGEMSLSNQAKLLRVLETREVRPLGSTQTVPLDIRIVTATNRDLGSAISDKSFREDLYYRLRGVVLEIPPLRRREGDVDLLAEHFLTTANQAFGLDVRGFDTGCMTYIRQQRWPGNVRQLRHVISTAAMLATRPFLQKEDIMVHVHHGQSPSPPPLTPMPAAPRPAPTVIDSESLALRDIERSHVARVLDMHGGNKSRTAESLEVSRHALYRLLRKHALI